MLKKLPLYVLCGIVMFAAFKVKGYEGLLAASVCLLYFSFLF